MVTAPVEAVRAPPSLVEQEEEEEEEKPGDACQAEIEDRMDIPGPIASADELQMHVPLGASLPSTGDVCPRAVSKTLVLPHKEASLHRMSSNKLPGHRGSAAEAKEAALSVQEGPAEQMTGQVLQKSQRLQLRFQSDRSRMPKCLRADTPVGLLHRAAREGFVETVRSLLNTGEASVNDTDSKNRTALHYACASGQREVVNLLLNYQGAFPQCDNEPCTPLMKAGQRDFRLCVDGLLGRGADPNDADIYGNTALHYAVLNEDVELAGLLLAYNANIEAKTKEGFTPYLLALQENNDIIAEFLEDMGADIHVEAFLDSKHLKTHLRKMRKHTPQRCPEAACSTGSSFFRRATNNVPGPPKPKRKANGSDFHVQVERMMRKELKGSKLHPRPALPASDVVADTAASGSGTAAPDGPNIPDHADSCDGPHPADGCTTPDLPHSTDDADLNSCNSHDTVDATNSDSLECPDTPNDPTHPDGSDTADGCSSVDPANFHGLDIHDNLHNVDGVDSDPGLDPPEAPDTPNLLFLHLPLLTLFLPLPFLLPVLILLVLVMLSPDPPHVLPAPSVPGIPGDLACDGHDVPPDTTVLVGPKIPPDPSTTYCYDNPDGRGKPYSIDDSHSDTVDGPDDPKTTEDSLVFHSEQKWSSES